MADDSEDGRWLSYAELAQARSIDVRSAIRTVRNRRWPKQKGNDGKIRGLVPTEFLEAKRYDPPEIPSEITREISRLEARVEFLTEQLNHERGRADSAEAQLTDMRVREGAAQARADELRAVMDRLTAWPGAGAWARLRELWQKSAGTGASTQWMTVQFPDTSAGRDLPPLSHLAAARRCLIRGA